jgi:hypothetical protein
MDAVSVATLFRRELLHMLADGYAGHELRALFYKCLRLTHERGRVSFYSELDDHIGFDRDGNSITFVGNAELYQLDTIANIARGITRFGITPRNVLVVCDFDLHKFAGYEIPRPQLMAYVTNVKEYLRDVDVDVVLQTEYFHSDTFHVTFADVLRSIMRRDGRFIHRTEFERIEQDYFRHYSKSMEGWNAARNEYYSIRSVARNVAEGLELSNGNAIVYVFNESLVNGERFSLKAANKVPFVGLRKVKLKKDPLANAL